MNEQKPSPDSPMPKTILVTGANRGIGLAICQRLLSNSPSPIHLFATSRSGQSLNLDPGAKHSITYPQLDIASPSSISNLATHIQTTSPSGGLNVLINNAGINLDNKYNPANARKTLEVNYHATLNMCQTFLPLLKKASTTEEPSRIVNLSSIGSQLKAYSPQLQKKFRSASSTLTLDKLDDIAQQFLRSVDFHSEDVEGFGGTGRSYSVSKACVNAFTFILARQEPDVLINCCCPGWVGTEMGNLVGKAPKSVEDGAKIPVGLAIGDVGGVSGKYWANGSIRGKGEGEVQEW